MKCLTAVPNRNSGTEFRASGPGRGAVFFTNLVLRFVYRGQADWADGQPESQHDQLLSGGAPTAGPCVFTLEKRSVYAKFTNHSVLAELEP